MLNNILEVDMEKKSSAQLYEMLVSTTTNKATLYVQVLKHLKDEGYLLEECPQEMKVVARLSKRMTDSTIFFESEPKEYLSDAVFSVFRNLCELDLYLGVFHNNSKN